MNEWLLTAPTEPGLLLPIDEPQRQRESLDPHGETGGYGCDYESRRDCDWRGDCAVVIAGVDFLIGVTTSTVSGVPWSCGFKIDWH